MKRLLLSCLLLISFFVSPVRAAPENYTFDSTHTYVLWTVNHMGFSTLSGKWLAEGTLVLDEANPKNSKVNITISMKDLVTGVPKLDEHLNAADFFDVAKYPTATFVSDRVEAKGKNKAKVYGTLTIHGVSKPVVLKVRLNKIGESPITKKKTAGFSAKTELKRSEFGVGKGTPGVADKVKIRIEAEANR